MISIFRNPTTLYHCTPTGVMLFVDSHRSQHILFSLNSKRFSYFGTQELFDA